MKDAKISARQAGMLCALAILANKLFLLPSLLYQDVKTDGIISLIINMVLELSVVVVFFVLKSHYPKESFYDILKSHVGIFVAKLVLLAFVFFFFFKTILTFTVSYVFLKRQLYQDEFIIIALFAVLPVINHAVISGLRSFSRTIELFFYVMSAGLLVCLVIGITSITAMPVLFTNSIGNILNSSFKHMFHFGDYLFLFLIMDKIEIKQNQGRKMLKYILFAVIFVMVLTFTFFAIYNVTAFTHGNAIADVTTKSVIFSSVGRIDIFAMFSVLFITFFQLEIFLYGFCDSFHRLMPKLNKVYALVLYDVLFFVIFIVKIGKYEGLIYFVENYLPYFCIVTNILIPLMLFIIALLQKKEEGL